MPQANKQSAYLVIFLFATSFIIDIFKKVSEIREDALLMLVGDGELLEEMKKKVSSLGLDDKVMFLGSRDDVSDLMQAMDVFIFPSLYEGFPLTMIEAQSSGLNCIISDKIPQECIISKNVKIVGLDKSCTDWANEVINMYNKKRNQCKEIDNNKYDIKSNTLWLEDFYLENSTGGNRYGNTYSIYTHV